MKPFNLQKFLAGEPITTLGGHQVVAFRYDTNFNDIFPLTVAIKDNTGLISNYQYSIDGEPLGTIDSNYILCMKDTELSINNNKQQTAVEWLWEIAYNRELTLEDWKQAKEKGIAENEIRYSDGYKEGYNRALELTQWAISNLVPPHNEKQ